MYFLTYFVFAGMVLLALAIGAAWLLVDLARPYCNPRKRGPRMGGASGRRAPRRRVGSRDNTPVLPSASQS